MTDPTPQARPVEREIAAVVGELVHDLGSELDEGWFIVGEGGYFDVDNACWCVDQEGDAPWTSKHFRLFGTIPDLIARERAAAAQEALRETADAWQTGGWADALLPHPKPPANPTIARSHRVLDWLRDRIGGDPA